MVYKLAFFLQFLAGKGSQGGKKSLYLQINKHSFAV